MDSSGSTSVARNLQILNRGRAPSINVAFAMLAHARERGLHFVAQTVKAATSGDVAAAVHQAHGLEIVVEPVFASVDPAADANGMERFFLLTLPGLSRADLSESAFDVAYQLRDQTPGITFASVELDLPNGAYVADPVAYDPDFSIVGVLCNVSDPGPEDRYWHLDRICVPNAWALPPHDGGKALGEGIIVAHPDTGWAEHVELDAAALDLTRSWNFCEDNANAHDPLWTDVTTNISPVLSTDLFGLRSPGHGTGTGSVIVSRGVIAQGGSIASGSDTLAGVAPKAMLVPIRAIPFVFVEDAIPVARAIEHAANTGCHVISMSLGGIGVSALEAAVNYAVGKDLIVCAAAGNCLTEPGWAGLIAPGCYRNCIAAAGTNSADHPWAFSSRGPTVDISAPAENVWKAQFHEDDPTKIDDVDRGQGTSFAVASVAGVAALWLAHHGRDNLLAKYHGQAYLHHVFAYLLQQTARRPGDWWQDEQFGPGIVNAEDLLLAALPDPELPILQASLENLRLTPWRTLLAAVFPRETHSTIEISLTRLLAPGRGVGTPEGQAEIERWGPELAYVLLAHREAFQQYIRLGESLLPPDMDVIAQSREMALVAELTPRASTPLRDVLRMSVP